MNDVAPTKDAAFGAISTPLDAVRASLLRVAGRPGRRLLAPWWAFALGPIVLGVPHLVADIPYLVVQPGLHRRGALLAAVGFPLPEEARPRPGIRSFRSSLRALEDDLGSALLVVAALSAVAVAARAIGSIEAARLLYLRGAGFHAYLEIALGCLFLLEHQRAPGRGIL